MKKSKKILLALIFGFGLTIMPKTVFATTANLSCPFSGDGSAICPTTVESEALINYAKVQKIDYLNLEIDGITYNTYFMYAHKKDSPGSSNFTAFKSSTYGIDLVTAIEPYERSNWIYKDPNTNNINSGYFNSSDILKSYPYFSLIKAYSFPYVMFFTYTDEVILKYDNSFAGNKSQYLIPYSSRQPKAGALTFYLVFADSSKKEALFITDYNDANATSAKLEFPGTVYQGCAQPGSSSFCGNYINSTYYFQVIQEYNLFCDIDSNQECNEIRMLDSIYSSSSFSSNSNIKDINGNKIEYSNKQDLTFSSSNSDFSDLAPKSLSDLIAMIPKMLKTLYASFALVGSLFTIVLSTFPPIVTFGLYTIFTIGIVILIIKTLT